MHLIENPFLLFVFANDDSYCDGSTAAGGWNDFHEAYPDAAQAAQVGGRYDGLWSSGGKWHVVDIRDRKIVAEGECTPPLDEPTKEEIEKKLAEMDPISQTLYRESLRVREDITAALASGPT